MAGPRFGRLRLVLRRALRQPGLTHAAAAGEHHGGRTGGTRVTSSQTAAFRPAPAPGRYSRPTPFRYRGYVPNQIRPETTSWNIGIQHVFRGDYTFESRYVGTHSVHLSVQDRLNATGGERIEMLCRSTRHAESGHAKRADQHPAGLENTYDNEGFFDPGFLNAGFQSLITAYMPWGSSIYHGWANL